ncbi:NB-ARC domain-containing protein [Streptomyces venezuelae]|uniref:NB-ARC domain-containing protein n=1 Tax=Streptomyces venezuelae TaxID=54571 RepID=UPI00278C6D57|nr:NB-ARC domain-containing protein [Streptomyces venezuelae]
MLYADRNSVVAQQVESVTINYAPQKVISWPAQVGVVPAQAECFQHRSEVDSLEAAVIGGGTAVLCQVLSGTGGVGKTQLAAHYARRQQASGGVDLLVWVSATGRDAVLSAYGQAAAKVTGADGAAPEQAADEFLVWLGTTDRRWLIVLDDLADPGDMAGLWPPHRPAGQTVVTTRRRDSALERGREMIEVGLFTPEEAFSYLTATLAPRAQDQDPDQLRGLAQDLGHLPLALAQAAAYMVDRGLDCAAYRRRFMDRRRRLADNLPESGSLPDQQRATVATTWSLSVELADQLAPVGLARPMLQLCSLLDAHGIPKSALTSAPALTYLSAFRTRRVPGAEPPPRAAIRDEPATGHEAASRGEASAVDAVDAVDADDALWCLYRLNLVGNRPEPGSHVRVHGLIQRATRDQLPPDSLDGTVRAAADALCAAWPARSVLNTATNSQEVFRANADALHAHAAERLWALDAHTVLTRSATSLGTAGLTASAAAAFKELAVAAAQHLGQGHEDTRQILRWSAGWLSRSGDFVGAIETTEGILADQLRRQEGDRPDTLSTRSDLAELLGQSGDREGAVAVLEELAADLTRLTGEDDPAVARTRRRIAHWMQMHSGDHVAEIAELEAVLADQVARCGPGDPETFATRGAIAELRGQSGDREGAIAGLEALLVDQIRARGEDHNDVTVTRRRVAHWRPAGDLQRAIATLEDVLARQLKAWGPGERTIATRAALADRRGQAGDRAGAIADLEKILVDQVARLGEKHPQVMATRRHLAHWQQAGDSAARIATLEGIIADQRATLGAEHAKTIATRGELADLRGLSGDIAGAIEAFEAILSDQRETAGPLHKKVVSTCRRLSNWWARSGDHATAVAVLEDLLADQERVLGVGHPQTIATRTSIADARGFGGDVDGAITAFEAIHLEHREGPLHPTVITTCRRIAYWRSRKGDVQGAIAVLQELLVRQRRQGGPRHPKTLATGRDVVYWRRQLGYFRSDSGPVQETAAVPAPGRFVLRWRAADGTTKTMEGFSDARAARQAGEWARRGGGTDVEVVEESGPAQVDG